MVMPTIMSGGAGSLGLYFMEQLILPPSVHRSVITVLLMTLGGTLAACSHIANTARQAIDRQALVERHIPINIAADSLSPLSVGNGEFAVTVDVTGLQSFPAFYEAGIPLGTLAQWGWHSQENPADYALEQTFEHYPADSRPVAYAALQHTDAGQWLRANPHRLHLGHIGLTMTGANGEPVGLNGLHDIDQHLDLWHGVINSHFQVEDEKVAVLTAVHPDRDQLATRIQSPLLARGQLQLKLSFPYGSQSWGKTTADWTQPERHRTRVVQQSTHTAVLERQLDGDRYYVQLAWEGKANLTQTDDHIFHMQTKDPALAVTVHYLQQPPEESNASATATFAASRHHWPAFWQSSGAIDLSATQDPRAHELERRMVLSRYLTAIQTAGSLPPAETGLTYNSWYGKFHLEMHWWHGVHYVLWNKPELFEKSLPWYSETALAQARQKADRQGYKGARWPKMIGPSAEESPSTIGVFLIWQQPHPIYFAELLYQYHDQDPALLKRFEEIVFATAEFMADYAIYEPEADRYRLGPPLIPGQEIYPPKEAFNPVFELAYWRYGLTVAQAWRQRLGLAPEPKWAEVLAKLSDYPMHQGLYPNAENALDTFIDPMHRNDHPTMLGAYGMLPGPGIDSAAMARTLQEVLKDWNWQRTWGWDYPMIAMTAARVGQPEVAVDALLLDVQKNRYLNNGHNYQDENLTIYLPGNGGLLTALAMMAAGWEGGPDTPAPGFPSDWTVHYENLRPLP